MFPMSVFQMCSEVVKSSTKCESATQTDVHPVATNVVADYQWNEWELRKKAIQMVGAWDLIPNKLEINTLVVRKRPRCLCYSLTNRFTWVPVSFAHQRDSLGADPPELHEAGERHAGLAAQGRRQPVQEGRPEQRGPPPGLPDGPEGTEGRPGGQNRPDQACG